MGDILIHEQQIDQGCAVLGQARSITEDSWRHSRLSPPKQLAIYAGIPPKKAVSIRISKCGTSPLNPSLFFASCFEFQRCKVGKFDVKVRQCRLRSVSTHFDMWGCVKETPSSLVALSQKPSIR